MGRPPGFDPERFSPENFKALDRWQYLPFGGGPRSCIGDHFAMLQVTLALATVIRGVQIRSLDDEFPLALHFTMIAGGPIRARAPIPSLDGGLIRCVRCRTLTE